MLRVALVDDERLARQGLRQSLARVGGVVVVGEADGVVGARELLARENPDAVFLDVNMPQASGFELLSGSGRSPKIVFVTAHAEHAVRAFEVEAVDFLLKPVRFERLGAAVERLRVACGADGGEVARLGRTDRICLRTPGRTVVAELRKIVALEADGDFTRIHIAKEEPLMICQSIGRYERVLPMEQFVRVDRSLIVNRDAVTRWRRVSRDDGLLWLEGKAEPVSLGRAAQARLRAAVVAGRAERPGEIG